MDGVLFLFFAVSPFFFFLLTSTPPPPREKCAPLPGDLSAIIDVTDFPNLVRHNCWCMPSLSVPSLNFNQTPYHKPFPIFWCNVSAFPWPYCLPPLSSTTPVHSVTLQTTRHHPVAHTHLYSARGGGCRFPPSQCLWCSLSGVDGGIGVDGVEVLKFTQTKTWCAQIKSSLMRLWAKPAILLVTRKRATSLNLPPGVLGSPRRKKKKPPVLCAEMEMWFFMCFFFCWFCLKKNRQTCQNCSSKPFYPVLLQPKICSKKTQKKRHRKNRHIF